MAATLEDGTLRLAHGDWPAPAAGAERRRRQRMSTLPDWARRPAPVAERPLQPLSPSDLGGAKVLPGEADADAVGRGEAARDASCTCCWNICRAMPRPTGPPLRSARSLRRGPRGSACWPRRGGADRCRAWPLFAAGALAEVAVTGEIGAAAVPGLHRPAGGRRRTACWRSTSSRTGWCRTRPEDVPEGILRQMGAYAALLEQIYPDRAGRDGDPVDRKRRVLMPLPRALVMAALQRAGFP